MSKIVMHLELMKQLEIPFCDVEAEVFTKPAQLTNIRDILALYSTGQIAPSLKTLPSEDTFNPQRPYSNIQDVEMRYRAKQEYLNKMLENVQNSDDHANVDPSVSQVPESPSGTPNEASD